MAGDKTLEGYPRYMAAAARTEEEFREWKKFFESMRDDSAVSRAIVIGEKEITARLKLIRDDESSVIEALERIVR